MESQINQLKERVFEKRSKFQETGLTNILAMVREFSCLGEIIGRDFEIRNSTGELVYTIRQKPIAICQLNTLLKEFVTLKNLDDEREAKKWGVEKTGRLNKRK